MAVSLYFSAVQLVLLGTISASFHRNNLRNQVLKLSSHSYAYPMTSTPGYTVEYFSQELDHFSLADQRTFQQRYLVNEEEWDKQGPILLYTGNEGDITWFWNNTGFVFKLSTTFHALVIFIEHRYYGDSLPFGKVSFQDEEHLGYLTTEQALADFASLIVAVKGKYSSDSPVIAIGGSYGGMLAAWMRMKYPNVVIGALAASAPIWWFTGLTPCNSAFITITDDFEQATPDWPNNPYTCSGTIRKSWSALHNISSKADGLEWLSDTFGLCQPLKNASSVADLQGWLSNTWFNLAMVDYPVDASFLEPLPAWPINITCKLLSKPVDSDKEVIQAIASGVGVYYNYTGQTKCYNLDNTATPNLGTRGWDYQACTEMVMPMCSDGVTDMFWPEPWDLKAIEEDCMKKYGVPPQPYHIEMLYGGKNISSHSNIIFSNGLLDPWHGGGVLENITDSLIAIVLPNGAHHYDLRPDNCNDSQEVVQARQEEMHILSQWIYQKG